jgi:hypothetical protein
VLGARSAALTRPPAGASGCAGIAAGSAAPTLSPAFPCSGNPTAPRPQPSPRTRRRIGAQPTVSGENSRLFFHAPREVGTLFARCCAPCGGRSSGRRGRCRLRGKPRRHAGARHQLLTFAPGERLMLPPTHALGSRSEQQYGPGRDSETRSGCWASCRHGGRSSALTVVTRYGLIRP